MCNSTQSLRTGRKEGYYAQLKKCSLFHEYSLVLFHLCGLRFLIQAAGA